MRKAVEICLTAEQENKLTIWATGCKHARRLTVRARIVLNAYTSVAHLEACLKEYVESHNKNPQPFVWTKSADEILEIDRAGQEGASSTLYIIYIILRILH